jgi:hypothetical protein
MMHRDRVRNLKASYQLMLEKLKHHDAGSLPKGVKVDKLEKAYESLKGYRFVLQKKETTKPK